MIRLWKDEGSSNTATIIIGAFIVILIAFLIAWFTPVGKIIYTEQIAAIVDSSIASTTPVIENKDLAIPIKFVATHIKTPEPLKAIYMSSWAAGHEKFRKHLFDLADSTEINAVVIDVKDFSGRIAFDLDDPEITASGVVERRIPDIKDLIIKLHEKNIYVIARISSFQDSFLINIHPEWAVKTKDGSIWKDYKGVKWLDPGAKPVWDYLVKISKLSYDIGFDEINFDYIRFPSDGNLVDIAYSWGEGKQRVEVIKEFFAYIHKEFSGTGIPISADLFGLTTSADDDLGIGQILELGLKYFDYVSPMVYPSHFGKGYGGIAKPAEFPYEVIYKSMGAGIKKAEATTTKSKFLGIEMIASTSPQLYTKESFDKNKLRPWLQAFDIGAVYTPELVRAQIKATNDLGLTSWMLWNAGSVYKKEALLPK